jgi:polar amino acid transport system permease protein
MRIHLKGISMSQSTPAPELPPEILPVLNQIAGRQRRFSIQVKVVSLIIVLALLFLLKFLGLDFMFMKKWSGFILKGTGITLLVSVMAISLACIIALVGALGRLSRNPLANGIASFYVSLVRGTPLLVQVFMWYLALPQLGQALEEVGLTGAQKLLTLPAIPAGILALGVCYGAYMTETFRAGIQSINIGQTEAAQALGMTESQITRRIILPQALRVIIPPVSNEFIAMIKDSSLVSLMGVWEISYRAQKIGRRYFRSLEMLIMAALFYWVLCIILQTIQERIETHMARGERKRH